MEEFEEVARDTKKLKADCFKRSNSTVYGHGVMEICREMYEALGIVVNKTDKIRYRKEK